MTMSLPLAGNLSDSFGRKRIFLVCLILFTCSSLLCGLSPNIYALIGFRFLQGVGGAAFLPTASGIVSEHFPENRERMIGLFTSIFPLGGIIGPNLGGWIVSTFSWRYIFYINLPIGLVLIGMILMLLDSPKTVSRPHADLAGVFSMCGGILFLMFGLNLIGESFERRSVLFAGAFLATSLTLLRSTPFLAANTLNLVIGAGVFGVFAFLPYYATSVHRLSTLASGMMLTPRSLGTIPASAACAFLLKRVGYRRPIIGGLVLTACALFLFAPGHLWDLMAAHFSAVAILSLLIFLSGIGLGVALPAANNACIELLPQKVGTIVGLRGMFRTVGGALGVSLLTFILHVSGDPVKGFRLVFTLSGIAIFCAIPLVFLMPAGRKGWT
jgi:MFS family permease